MVIRIQLKSHCLRSQRSYGLNTGFLQRRAFLWEVSQDLAHGRKLLFQLIIKISLAVYEGLGEEDLLSFHNTGYDNNF